MKRLRTLSIRNPGALARRNYRSAWGIAYWVKVNRRKHWEHQMRAMRGMTLVHLVPLVPAGDQLPGEHTIDPPRQAPKVH